MINRVQKNRFNSNVVKLLTGTALAQLIPILASPILTRLYSPEEFGMLALFISITSIIATISTGRYELAILLPRRQETAVSLVALSTGLTALTSILVLLFVVLFEGWLMNNSSLGASKLLVYLLPLTVFLTAFFQIQTYLLNRDKNYRFMSVSKVLRALVTVGTHVMYALVVAGSGLGLVLGHVIGLFIPSFLILVQTRQPIKFKRTIRVMKVSAWRYRSFPKFLMLAHGLNTGAGQLPNILLASFFGATTVGFFSLAQRTLSAPITIVAKSIGDVFRQQASEEYINTGNCRTIYLATLKKLVLLSAPFTILIFLFSPILFEIVFGAEWTTAGIYVRVMSFMLFMRFISTPLSSMFIIAERQRADLIWQLALFGLTTVSLWSGYFIFKSAMISIVLFSLAYTVMYAINLFLSYKMSFGK